MPPRRRPALRILLLGGFGILVYLKFDAFIASRPFRYLRDPASMREALASWMAGSRRKDSQSDASGSWSADSSRYAFQCPSARLEPCLQALESLGPGTSGKVSALLYKARLQLRIPSPTGFNAVLEKPLPEASGPADREIEGSQARSILEVARLELTSEAETWTLEARSAPTGQVRYCTPRNRCLDDLRPAPPFHPFASRPSPGAPDLILLPPEAAAFGPVLAGRIVELSARGDGARRIKLYHGRNLFSYYLNFGSLQTGLATGDYVNTADTLGYAAGGGDSSTRLSLRIEKDGAFIDPLAFLGLEAGNRGAGHGR